MRGSLSNPIFSSWSKNVQIFFKWWIFSMTSQKLLGGSDFVDDAFRTQSNVFNALAFGCWILCNAYFNIETAILWPFLCKILEMMAWNPGQKTVFIGVARIFDWRGLTANHICNDIIRNFRKEGLFIKQRYRKKRIRRWGLGEHVTKILPTEEDFNQKLEIFPKCLNWESKLQSL